MATYSKSGDIATLSVDAKKLEGLDGLKINIGGAGVNEFVGGKTIDDLAAKLSEIEKAIEEGKSEKEIHALAEEASGMLNPKSTAGKAVKSFASKTNKFHRGLHQTGHAINKAYTATAEFGFDERKHLNFTVPQLDAGIKSLDEAIANSTDPRLIQRLQTQQRKYINAKHYINSHYQKSYNVTMQVAKERGMVTFDGKVYKDKEGKEITLEEFAKFKNIITVNMIKNPSLGMDKFKSALAGIGKVLGTGKDLVNDHRKLVAGTGIAIASALTISNFMSYQVGADSTVGAEIKNALNTFFSANPKLKAALNVLAITGLVIGVSAAAEKVGNARNRAAQRRRAMDSIQAGIETEQEAADRSATAPLDSKTALQNDLANKVPLEAGQIERIADEPELYKHLKTLASGKDPADPSKKVSPSVRAYAIRTLGEVDKKRAEFSSAAAEARAQKQQAAAEALRQKNIASAVAEIIGTSKSWAEVESSMSADAAKWTRLCGLLDANYGTSAMDAAAQAKIDAMAMDKVKTQINLNMQRDKS